MKKILLILLSSLFLLSMKSDDCITADGYFRGVRLCGRVQIVERFPDFKVKVVDHFPDLKVKVVNTNANDPGEWQMVDRFPDIKIQIVDHFEDFTIRFVTTNPGVAKSCN